jgi:hypothetical protein
LKAEYGNLILELLLLAVYLMVFKFEKKKYLHDVHIFNMLKLFKVLIKTETRNRNKIKVTPTKD